MSYVQVILNIAEQFEKEKPKLYEAIGYHENEEDPTFPREVSVIRKIKCVFGLIY